MICFNHQCRLQRLISPKYIFQFKVSACVYWKNGFQIMPKASNCILLSKHGYCNGKLWILGCRGETSACGTSPSQASSRGHRQRRDSRMRRQDLGQSMASVWDRGSRRRRNRGQENAGSNASHRGKIQVKGLYLVYTIPVHTTWLSISKALTEWVSHSILCKTGNTCGAKTNTTTIDYFV